MFKKTGHIIISALLVIVITGITVNLHYCGDRLYSVNINVQTNNCCDNDDCGHCKDKSVKLEIHDDFLPVLNNGLTSETISYHLVKLFSKDLSLVQGLEEVALYGIYAPDISPPGVNAKLSLLQTYLL